MANFWEHARQLARRVPGAYAKNFQIVEKAREKLLSAHRYARSIQDTSNLESLYSCLELGELTGLGGDWDSNSLKQARLALIRLIAETLDLSQDLRIKYSYRQPDRAMISGPEGYQSLVRLALLACPDVSQDRFDFITFNYDIGLEVALHLHGMPFSYALRPSDGDASTEPGHLLLKLHGSVNWIAKDETISQIDANDSLSFLSTINVMADKATIKPHRSPVLFRSQAEIRKKRPDALPFIVPPSDAKGHRRETIAPLWRLAAQLLRKADVIMIIGYSIPLTDSFFRQLIWTSSVNAADLRKIIVINPDSDACDRAVELFRPELHTRIWRPPEHNNMIDALDLLTAEALRGGALHW